MTYCRDSKGNKTAFTFCRWFSLWLQLTLPCRFTTSCLVKVKFIYIASLMLSWATYCSVLSSLLERLHGKASCKSQILFIHVQCCDIIMRFTVLHNRHHKVSQSAPFFMHCKAVSILLRIRVRGCFVMSITKNHESYYVSIVRGQGQLGSFSSAPCFSCYSLGLAWQLSFQQSNKFLNKEESFTRYLLYPLFIGDWGGTVLEMNYTLLCG